MKRSMLITLLAMLFIINTGSYAIAAGPYRIILKNGGKIMAALYEYSGDIVNIYLMNPAGAVMAIEKSSIEKIIEEKSDVTNDNDDTPAVDLVKNKPKDCKLLETYRQQARVVCNQADDSRTAIKDNRTGSIHPKAEASAKREQRNCDKYHRIVKNLEKRCQ